MTDIATAGHPWCIMMIDSMFRTVFSLELLASPSRSLPFFAMVACLSDKHGRPDSHGAGTLEHFGTRPIFPYFSFEHQSPCKYNIYRKNIVSFVGKRKFVQIGVAK